MKRSLCRDCIVHNCEDCPLQPELKLPPPDPEFHGQDDIDVDLDTGYSVLPVVVRFKYHLEGNFQVHGAKVHDSSEDVYDFLDARFRRDIDTAIYAWIAEKGRRV